MAMKRVERLSAWFCAPAVVVVVMVIATACVSSPLTTVAAGPLEGPSGSGYRVLKPIQSGDLTLFPVVRGDGKASANDPFLTLDEGLRSGEVEVTEAGSVRGLVRPRGPAPAIYRGDQVNTLVLVNHSSRPLLLLAGEIVTGGKQDRIVASDRIVPVDSDPVDLSVFCVEHGRWTESSATFGVTAKSPAKSFMVQPEVRQQAMVAKSQQQVWDSVSTAVAGMAVAAAPPSSGAMASDENAASTTVTVENRRDRVVNSASLGTTSYAKAMQMDAVSAQVDKAVPELMNSREQVLSQLKQEHAVGVVVAVRGEVIWADVFADTDLLTRYWSKLVRSYAAEGLTEVGRHDGGATQADAQRFLDTPMRGAESSTGEVGVYRCLEAKAGTTEQFVLESLLPGENFDVHMSRLKVRGAPVAHYSGYIR
jgi:hypothetical protein